MFSILQNSLLSIIYPRECFVCRRQVEDLNDGAACGECWEETRIFSGSEMLCHKCGAFFGDGAAPVPVFCHKCDDHVYNKAVAAGIYEKALAAAIITLKTEPKLSVRMRSIIGEALFRVDLQDTDLIIPIPLSKLRKIERGFNQAEIIALEVGRKSRIAIDVSSLARKLHTPMHRIGMDQKARDLTVRNAFEVLRPNLISGKNILLVDDVFTSGATSSHCAKVLKKNGAGKVDVFTLARAVIRY